MSKAFYFSIAATVIGGIIVYWISDKLAQNKAVASGTINSTNKKYHNKKNFTVAYKNSGGGFTPGYVNIPFNTKDRYSTGPNMIHPVMPSV
jgi:hypothetical protein